MLKKATKCVAILIRRLNSIELNFMNICLKYSENYDWLNIKDINFDLNDHFFNYKQATRFLFFCSVFIKT